MARILVVDDEPHIREVVRAYLVRDGHAVVTAADGDAAMEIARRDAPDLIVLDVMLPLRSGFDVLRELRAGGSTAAVVMLTARDEVIDRVAGLETGADDYLTKPFEPRELVARVSAVLRRTGGERPPAPPAPGAIERFFDLEIDHAGHEVRRRDTPLALTRAEFDLLAALSSHPGIAMSRAQLGDLVFGEEFDAYDRTIDSHIKNLRHKLGTGPGGRSYVETVRGVGYRGARP
ncbi:MAG TPA: response regulator transcription factor [Candidatus Limnocylindrales bacterium]|jgi:DNA-binding response OmpR family regulator|nr:response regulator transcription factor [Candidatus Limnocylindrales bacterium]